jgi:UrcA family protein
MNAYRYAGLIIGLVLAPCAALGDDMHVTKDAYGEVRQIAVRTGDLDLTRAEGAQALLQRLKFAAARACDANAPDRDLRMMAFRRDCVADTLDRAVASVSAPLVKRLYADSRR